MLGGAAVGGGGLDVTAEERFWSKVRTSGEDECWEWQAGHCSGGYGTITIGGRTRSAHRVAYELAHGAIPDGMNVCHHCDNPGCVNPNHLYAGDQRENIYDAVCCGRMATGQRNGAYTHPEHRPHGEGHGRAKLTWSQVLEARRLHAEGIGYHRLAHRYDVGENTIRDAILGKTWRA